MATALSSVSRLIFHAESLESEGSRLKGQLKNALADLEEANNRKREVDRELATFKLGSRKAQSVMQDEMSAIQSKARTTPDFEISHYLNFKFKCFSQKLEAMSCRASEQQRIIDQIRGETDGSQMEKERSTLDSERLSIRLTAVVKEREMELSMVQDQNKAQWKLIEALEAEQRSLKSELTSLSNQSKEHLERVSNHQQSVQASIVQSDEFLLALSKAVEQMDLAIEETEVEKKRSSELEADKARLNVACLSLKKEISGQADRIRLVEERLAAERLTRKEMMGSFQKTKDLLAASLSVQRDQRGVILQLRDEMNAVPAPLPSVPHAMPVDQLESEGKEERGGEGSAGGDGGSMSEGVDVTEMQIEGGDLNKGGGSEAISPPSLIPENTKAAAVVREADDAPHANACALVEEGGSQPRMKKPRLGMPGSEMMKPAGFMGPATAQEGGVGDEMEVEEGTCSDGSDPQAVCHTSDVLCTVFASMKKV